MSVCVYIYVCIYIYMSHFFLLIGFGLSGARAPLAGPPLRDSPRPSPSAVRAWTMPRGVFADAATRAQARQLYEQMKLCSSATLEALAGDMGCENGAIGPRSGSRLDCVVGHLVGVSACTLSRWRREHWRDPVSHSGPETTADVVAVGTAQAAVGAAAEDRGTAAEHLVNEADTTPLPKHQEVGTGRDRTMHPHYKMGMTLANLATLWAVEAWPKEKFGEFVAWASTRFPYELGTYNNSKNWINEFLYSLMAEVHVATCATLHTVVPATGLPSFLSRVIDIVSSNAGASYLPVVYVYTSPTKGLQWCLLGCPVLEYKSPASAAQAAVGARVQPARLEMRHLTRDFKFHSAQRLVETVHRVEHRANINRDDRLFRMAVTLGDQAIQGPTSTKFSQKEAQIHQARLNKIAVGICAFHVADGIGVFVDKHYDQVDMFDRLLRILRQYFARGTGRLILRAVAAKNEEFALAHEQRALLFSARAAERDAVGQAPAAERWTKAAAKELAEARALRHAGWCQWRVPLAPRTTSTRKVVYQTKARKRFFEIYALLAWGLQVKRLELLQNAHMDAVKQGRTPTNKLGINTTSMRALRAVGRSMTDIPLLVFNMGRADFRERHLAAYALDVQASMHSVFFTNILATASGMSQSVGALMSIRAIVEFLRRLCACVSGAPREHRPLKNVTMTTLWATAKTFLAHMGWRHFPMLSLSLPEILLGGTFKGISLSAANFAEPSEEDLEGLPSATEFPAQRPSQRDARFLAVLNALDSLRAFAAQERRTFLEMALRVEIFKRDRPCPMVGLPPVLPDTGSASASDEEPSAACSASDEEHERPRFADGRFAPRFAPRRRRAPDFDDGDARPPNDSALADAAIDLATRCSEKHEKVNGDALYAMLAQARERVGGGHASESDDEASLPDVDAGREDDEETEYAVSPAVGGASAAAGAASSASADTSPPARGGTPASSAAATSASSVAPSMRVIYTIIESGAIRVVCGTARTYEAMLAKRIVNNLDARNKFLLFTDVVFHFTLRDALLDVVSEPPGGLDLGMRALRAIYDACQGNVWGLSKETWSYAVVRDPPEELFSTPTFEMFHAQYQDFVSWVRTFPELPFGHEFFTIRSYTVQRCSPEGECLGEPFVVPREDLEDACRWQRWTPKRGTRVTSRGYGHCFFLSASREPDFAKVYAFVQSRPRAEIQARKLWNIVVAQQFTTHVSVTTESLAETVGSYLQAIQSKTYHKQFAHAPLAYRAMLRAVGVRGLGGEEHLMDAALSRHFQSTDPAHWKFTTVASLAAVGACKPETALRAPVVPSEQPEALSATARHTLHRMAVREQRLPEYATRSFFQLLKRDGVRFCKRLPHAESFVLSRAERLEADKLKPLAKRRKVEAAAAAQHEPQSLGDSVWSKVGLTTLSLPSYLRPGAGFR